MKAIIYPEDYPTIETIRDGTAHRDYRPTLSSGLISRRHKFLSELQTEPGSVAVVYSVPGKLRLGDVLKLYEMAYFSRGPILELGTYRGLSSTIMGEALRDAGKDFPVYTADLSEQYVDMARRWHDKRQVTNVLTHHMEGGAFAREMVEKGIKFGVAFIDHWHGYDATVEICHLLPDLMMHEGFVVFHDFVHAGNASDDPDFGVFKAVEDTLSQEFKFYGVFGCCALYRYEPAA